MIQRGDVVEIAAGVERYLAPVTKGEDEWQTPHVTVDVHQVRAAGGSGWTTIPTESVTRHFKEVARAA